MSSKSLSGSQQAILVIPLHRLNLCLPLYGGVSAGFPSPADDYLEEHLDVGDYLVKNPTATFFVRVQGDSMVGAGIHPDDILVVDRSLAARHNTIIIAVLNGEFTVKRLYKKGGDIRLVPENPRYASLSIRDGDEFDVWGVVAHVLHKPT
ncbi:MAG: translesion error-prone DNA polymerase V autoproteolytic subunit [Saprospiraceae bacterium]